MSPRLHSSSSYPSRDSHVYRLTTEEEKQTIQQHKSGVLLSGRLFRHHVPGLHHHDRRLRGRLLPFEAAALAAPRARDDAQCEDHDAADDYARDGAAVRLAAVRHAFISVRLYHHISITTPGCAGCTFRLKQQHLQHHAHATMLRATATMQPMTIPAMTPASKVVVSVVHVN